MAGNVADPTDEQTARSLHRKASSREKRVTLGLNKLDPENLGAAKEEIQEPTC